MDFRKNIVKQIGDKGCKTEYNQSDMFQKLVALICALAFVPVPDIIHAWTSVVEPFMYRNQDNLTETMDDFLDCFISTYLGKVGRSGRRGNPRIKLDVWSKYEAVLKDIPCTNNAVEAFNGAWNRSTPSNPSLWTVLDGFIREEGLMRQKLHDARIQVGSNTGNSREIYSRDKQLRLQNVVKQYNTMELYSYLEEVGTIINM